MLRVVSNQVNEILCHRRPRSPACCCFCVQSPSLLRLLGFNPHKIRDINLLPPSSSSPSLAMGEEKQGKEFEDLKSGGKDGGGGISDRILPHLLRLYESRATVRDFEIYAPNATFEDPLMCAHGVKQIKSAFYSLPKFFSESRIVEYTVQENATGPGKAEILIDNKQYYKMFGRDIDLISLIRLEVEEGKVIRHEDWWDRKPLKNRNTVNVPLVGRLAEATRRGSMLITHALMGFGKDPSP